MKKVSVVVPCYNAAQYLKKCVDHLLRQTIGIENIEIILVDDASTDGGKTWELITEFESQYPETIIAVSLKQNLRQGGARNVGVSYAGGEYLIFCDADDWLLEETLEHSYNTAREYDADVVEFLGKNVSDRECHVSLEKGHENRLIELATEDERKAFLLEYDEKLSYGSQTKLYRISLIRDNHIVFAEHRIFEEPSFVLPVRLYEKRHYFLDERLYVWYLSPGSTMRSDWGEHRWDNPKVWMDLIQDLAERDLLQKYYAELEFLFFSWGYGLSIKMMLQRGYILTKEEYRFLIEMIIKLFPDIRKNQYVEHMAEKYLWHHLLLTLLDIRLTEESILLASELLKDSIGLSRKENDRGESL